MIAVIPLNKLLTKTIRFLIVATLLLCSFSKGNLHSDNIGVAVVATGKYIKFIPPLVESIDRYFCKDHQVTIYVFTDSPDYDPPENVVCLYQGRFGWPGDSIMRYHAYYSHRDLFEDEDYIFALDADMLIVDDVGDEILSDHVAVTHFAYLNHRGTYEKNPKSTAFLAKNEGQYYVRGGFYGGSRDRFFHICKTCIDNIEIDSLNGIVAVWHDESHYNRYCWDFKPSLILNHSYCYPESGDGQGFPKKIVALDKHHTKELRSL